MVQMAATPPTAEATTMMAIKVPLDKPEEEEEDVSAAAETEGSKEEEE